MHSHVLFQPVCSSSMFAGFALWNSLFWCHLAEESKSNHVIEMLYCIVVSLLSACSGISHGWFQKATSSSLLNSLLCPLIQIRVILVGESRSCWEAGQRRKWCMGETHQHSHSCICQMPHGLHASLYQCEHSSSLNSCKGNCWVDLTSKHMNLIDLET